MHKQNTPVHSAQAQKKHTGKQRIRIRQTKLDDDRAFIKIEYDRYAQNYKEQPRKKSDVAEMFHRRYANAKRWMWTLEINGRPEGFITGQPTFQLPEEFTSWEQSTNNGTLDGTYQEAGDYVYVVNLDVSRRGTKLGGQYLLMAHLGARAIMEGKKAAVFESRMPEFREWLHKYAHRKGLNAQAISAKKLDSLAAKYSQTRRTIHGKSVPYDRLLRFYEKTGFTFVGTVRNAFNDPESLDYGVVCVGNNPIPQHLRVKPVNKAVGYLFKSVARSPKLFRLFVK